MPNKRDEAIEAAAAELFLTVTAHKTTADAIGFYWEDVPAATRAPWVKAAKALITAYEQVMHPLVEDMATLDTLPAGCVVLDADDQVWRNHVDPEGVYYWTCTGDDAGWSAGDVIIPARVLHRPTD